jgi:hypothetical protein
MNKQGYLGIDVSKGYADFLLPDTDCQYWKIAFSYRTIEKDVKNSKS